MKGSVPSIRNRVSDLAFKNRRIHNYNLEVLMRWFLRAVTAIIAVVALGYSLAPAYALMIAMRPAAQRAVTAEVVVVGKVTAIEKDAVEAAPFPGAPNKVAYKVAVVKIENGLAGAANITHVKIGFI